MKTHLLLSALLGLLCGVLNAQVITSTPASGCNCFTFSHQPAPSAIQWDFGDGQISNTISPTYCYGNVGTYQVTALVAGMSATDSIVVDDCCSGLMTLAAEDRCCFDLTFVNDQDQFFTGVNLGLETGPRVITGFGTGPNWAPVAPAGPNDLQLGYIGGPHIPVAATGGVRICLDGDTQTSGPTDLYTHWMVGPDTVCIDTIQLECELCEPEGKTYSKLINSVREPDPAAGIWDYNETGQGVVTIDAYGSVMYGGITESLQNEGILNASNNIMCGMADSCGVPFGVPRVASIDDEAVSWLDYFMLDIRGTNGVGYDFAKVGNLRNSNNGSIYGEMGIAFLDASGAVVNFRDFTQTPNDRETVNDGIVGANGDLYLAGTFWELGQPNKIMVARHGLGTPTNQLIVLDLGPGANEAHGIFQLQGSNNLLVTGKSGDQAFLLILDQNLGYITHHLYDVDGDNSTAEIGKEVGVNSFGQIVIIGEVVPNIGNKQLFFIRFPLSLQSPLQPISSTLIDFNGGGEGLSDMVIQGGNIFITGSARDNIFVNTPPGSPPNDRVYFARLDAFGNVIRSVYYDAHRVNQMVWADGSLVMVGTQIHEGPLITNPFPFPTTLSDIWLAKVDTDGRVAECDCYTPLPFEEPAAAPVWSGSAYNLTQAVSNLAVSYIGSEADITPPEAYCGPPCGPGGPGIPCPSNCCGYISGFKYEDKDMNGQQDLPFDSEICGWTIELIDDVTGAVLQTTTTNQAGFYAFTGLCAGSYRVREQLQNCWVQSAAPAGPINVGPNQWQYYRQDFGNWLEIDCGSLNAIVTDLIPGQPSCDFRLDIDNNVCPDIKLVQLRSNTPGVDLNLLAYQGGVTNYLPRPNSNSTINITGGNNPAVLGTVPSGNGVNLIGFNVTSDCDPVPNQPYELIIDYFVDLPCSLSDAYCSDTIYVECPLCPPECQVETVATPTADTTDLCCYDLTFNIGAINQDEFTSIEIRPVGGAQLTPLTALAGQYSPVQNTTSIIELISNTGSICPGTTLRYFPTGSLPSVEVCVTDFASSNPQITIDYVKCSGDVCPDTLTLPCNPCIEIVQDTTYCDGEQAKYEFTIRNTWNQPIRRLAVNGFQPAQLGFLPDTLFFPAPGIPVGGTVGPLTICLDNISHPDTAKFTFTALGDDDCCFCVSDLICAPVPFCCDTCESIDYMIRDTVLGNDSICCYSLDVYHCVPDTFFTALRVNALGGVTINQQTAGLGWAVRTPLFSSNVSQTFFPQPTPIHGAPIPDGWSNGKVNFCIGGVNDLSQIPQQIELEWLAGNDSNVVCVDTLQFECTPPTPDSNCVALADTLFECVSPGTYTLDLDLEIKRPGLTYAAWVQQFSSVPSGAIVTPVSTSLQGIWTTGTIISMPTITVSNVNPGDSICFVLALSDTIIAGNNTNQCCYSDTICLVVPPCFEPVCCDDIDALSAAVDSGWVCTISPNGDSLTIDNPDFDDCVSVDINWGDGSPTQTVPASQLPVTHPYATNDPWEWCAFVTAIDDDGALCFEGEYCKLVTEVAEFSNAALKLKLYPNPSRADLWLSIRAPKTERLTLEVFDSHGRSVMRTQRDVITGDQNISLEPGNLPGGYYLLRIQGADFVATEKFVRLP